MLVSILQLDAAAGGPDEYRKALVAGLERAAADGGGLLVAPELATSGYGSAEAIAACCETAAGPGLAALSAAVDRTGVSLVAGFPEARPDGRPMNSAALLRPGVTARIYRKAQLYGSYEKGLFEAGPVDSFLARVGSLTVGILICFDVEFPEHVRRLAQAGCDLVCVPTALPGVASSPFVAERVIPVRAFENQLFIAYADWAGHDGRFAYAGLSCIAAPDGADLVRAPAGGSFQAGAVIDPAAYAHSRRLNPYLAELRRS